jgi:hypothetical protein
MVSGNVVVAFAALILLAPAAGSERRTADSSAEPSVEAEAEDSFAKVMLDGQPLVRVRGRSAYLAARRAQAISERIAAIAADSSVAPDSLAVIDEGVQSRIVVGNQTVVTVYDSQAASEGVSPQALAQAFRTQIAQGIRAYRHDRDPRVLLTHAGYALGATLVAVLLLLGLRRAHRWVATFLDGRLVARIEGLEAQAYRLVQA